MKHARLPASRGSTLATAIFFSIVLMLMVGSLMRYSLTERRLNYRAQLHMEVRNAAEAISEYGLSQVKSKMDNRSDFSPRRFTSGADSVALPPASFFAGSHIDTSAHELVVGIIVPKTGAGGSFYYFDPNDPGNEFEPLRGRYAARFDIRILSKAIGQLSSGAPQAVYMTQTLSARASPLFSHAIFYNMDLELSPGAAMNIIGPVHTNGNLLVKKQSSSGTALAFLNQVTAAKGIYASGLKIPYLRRDGSADNLSSYTDDVKFTNTRNVQVALKDASTGVWRDQKMGQATETDATRTQFRTFASQTYNGNLQSTVHGIGVYNPVAIGDYVEDPTPTNGVDNSVNEGRKLIEPPLTASDAGYNAEVETQKYSTKAGLYIVVNPSTAARNGHLPDGSTVSIPAGKYRAFRKDGTEVVLPGQTTYGTNNATVNAATNAGGRPVITIKPTQFIDIRRAAFNFSAVRSAGNVYTPKTIDAVEVDMTALKMAVDRTVNAASTSTVYSTAVPANGTTTGNAAWTNYINNPSATPAATAITDANLITNLSAADWNGGVYIESVDAEARTAAADASGVRLVYGRGRIATTSDGTGLTLATNDAMYVLGHFNGDGTIDKVATSATCSANAPETNEAPASIAADAITLLSQPVFTNNGATVAQSLGWNDALSGLRCESNTTYSANWAKTPPSTSNTLDGTSAALAPTRDPIGLPASALATTTRNYKFLGGNTEISSAMLTGIVVSNKDGNGAFSGGAHNYPRFLEDFYSALEGQTAARTVAIRGSMVCMFESRVAKEPWTLRVYQAPDRLWGFNDLFSQGKFPPLTPRVMSYRRVDFNDIPAAEYNAAKTSWGF